MAGRGLYFEAFEDPDVPTVWRVEAIVPDSEDDRLVTIFCGEGAERRARSYAAWMNGAEVD